MGKGRGGHRMGAKEIRRGKEGRGGRGNEGNGRREEKGQMFPLASASKSADLHSCTTVELEFRTK